MTLRSLSSIALLKVSLLSGTTTIVLSWIEVLNGFAAVLKDVATISTACVAIWGAVAFFKLEVHKLSKRKKDTDEP